MATSRLAFLTLPIATVSLALAACGGGDPTAASDDDQRAQFREAAVDFARCMREHGVEMKDPTPGGGIMLGAGPGSKNNPAELDAAQEACQKHLEKVKPPEISEEQEREFKEKALEFARCMREHGIDMPDPTFEGGGGVKQRLPAGQGPENPRFQAAQQACAKYGPKMMDKAESAR